jgi:quinol monooxygenase YgiN
MSKVAVLAKIRSAPGKRAELAKEFQAAFAHVENEAGTLTYILHEDTKDEDLLWFYEIYTDQEALQAHGKSEWMKAMGPKLGPLMAGRAELTFLTPVGGKGFQP